MRARQRAPRHGGRHLSAGIVAGGKEIGIARQNPESVGQVGNRGFDAEFHVHVAAGQEPAQIAVSRFVFNQADDSPAGAGLGDLGTDNGNDALPAACRQEGPQPVEVVGVGQRQAGVAHPPGGFAEHGNGGGAPHQGVMGSDG